MGSDAKDEKEKGDKVSKTTKKLLNISYIRSFTREEVFSYIARLHRIVKKQENKLKKYKEKLKLRKSQRKNLPKEDKLLVKAAECDHKAEEKPKSFIDEIREAAEETQNQNGFVYEPTSGLYYDQKTGYYYNAEYGLYYDGNSGCYYQYDQEKNEFKFHSQVDVQRSEVDKVHENYYLIYLVYKFSQLKIDKMRENALDIAKKYPPSLRMIVQETNSSKLKVGALYIITYKGGSLGREGDHDVLIPDVNVSKYHLKFTYHEEKGIYQCIDLGSRNGTFLNGKRMSNAKQESESLDIVHGSVLQVSQTKLLCHIHTGNSTCGHCEPGLLIEQPDTQKAVALTHKEQLKKLQKRYGLENEKYVESKPDSQYNDRAATRRDKFGSTNEYEKTQMASTESEISSDNKGFKMLSKLGWNKGQTLGKGNDGLKEPIPLVGNEGTKGLGCTDSIIKPNVRKMDLRKTETWKKAQDRYKKLTKLNVFCDSSESD